MRAFSQIMTFFVMIFAVLSPTWARYIEHIPNERIILECLANDSDEVVAEVYDLTGTGKLWIGFRLDNGETGALPVEQEERSYRSKKGHAFFNLTLKHLDSDQYEFSVFEAELSGNGNIVVAAVNLICKKPNQ